MLDAESKINFREILQGDCQQLVVSCRFFGDAVVGNSQGLDLRIGQIFCSREVIEMIVSLLARVVKILHTKGFS